MKRSDLKFLKNYFYLDGHYDKRLYSILKVIFCLFLVYPHAYETYAEYKKRMNDKCELIKHNNLQ